MPAETPAAGSEASAMLADLKHTISLGPDAAANAAQRLLGAVEAVLEEHRKGAGIYCVGCCPRERWPCPTVQAITRELLGEETSRD